MATTDDDIVWSLTGNDDLIVAGLAPEDGDGTQEDAAALFGLDGDSGEGLFRSNCCCISYED